MQVSISTGWIACPVILQTAPTADKCNVYYGFIKPSQWDPPVCIMKCMTGLIYSKVLHGQTAISLLCGEKGSGLLLLHTCAENGQILVIINWPLIGRLYICHSYTCMHLYNGKLSCDVYEACPIPISGQFMAIFCTSHVIVKWPA